MAPAEPAPAMTDSNSFREWNSSEYHRLSQPQVSWGKKVLARLRLRGDEFILDAGCGSGRLTAELLEALPNGRVVGLDLSQNMVQTASQHLEQEFRGRISLVAADMTSLPFVRAFDGIVSTAAFHWVMDPARLFRNLFQALRPGGWLQAQCGGAGNIARLRERMRTLAQSPRYATYLADFAEPWVYLDAETAAAMLRAAGFVEVGTDLEAAPTMFESRQQYFDFVKAVIVRQHIERISDPELRLQYVSELTDLAASDDPPFLLDYWRLNMRGEVPE
jgi:trans-aconitate 2-methyltransferase